MKNENQWLLKYQKNVHSADGEDGIIEKILEVIPSNDKWCVEFGAWDGIFLTNTRNLILKYDYSAILIEGDTRRFKDLERNYNANSKVTALNNFVGFSFNSNLDHILSRTPIPTNFDLLSIDIDGNDYHVWKACEKYKPKVTIIEFNPTVPTHIEFIQTPDPSLNQGSSLMAMHLLAKSKGYELVCVTSNNAFFVLKEYFSLFNIGSNKPEDLRSDDSMVTYLFLGYDGTVFLKGGKSLYWHGIKFNEKNVQLLPSCFRALPQNFSWFIRLLWKVYRWPFKLKRSILKRLSSN